MKTKNFLVVLAVMSMTFSGLKAQTTNQQPCPCCSKAHNEFDFWIGDWTVYNAQGIIVGTNKISKVKEYSNCLLREEWKSSGTNRGTSYNYYKLSDKSWNQVWVDNSGFSLTLKGNRIANKMIMKSAILEGENGKYYNQITWQLNEDETVTQTWDIINEEGKRVQQAFKGIYKKTVK
ncbi:MAG: hypothetical protein QNJ57_04240 [Flavobacteriaceae bacterium]|nr:hypothetical protein [Flavobacteriaceae bacterium]